MFCWLIDLEAKERVVEDMRLALMEQEETQNQMDEVLEEKLQLISELSSGETKNWQWKVNWGTGKFIVLDLKAAWLKHNWVHSSETPGEKNKMSMKQKKKLVQTWIFSQEPLILYQIQVSQTRSSHKYTALIKLCQQGKTSPVFVSLNQSPQNTQDSQVNYEIPSVNKQFTRKILQNNSNDIINESCCSSQSVSLQISKSWRK